MAQPPNSAPAPASAIVSRRNFLFGNLRRISRYKAAPTEPLVKDSTDFTFSKLNLNNRSTCSEEPKTSPLSHDFPLKLHWPGHQHPIVAALAIRSRVLLQASSTPAALSVSPSRAAETSVAQAAEPQASVAPTPRSQTRSTIRSRALTSAKDMLPFSGKMDGSRSAGPNARNLFPRHRRRRRPRAGCPCSRRSPRRRGNRRAEDRPRAYPRPVARAKSRSTPTAAVPYRPDRSKDPAARTRSAPPMSPGSRVAPVCRARRSATQRVPLPQAPARLPSLL